MDPMREYYKILAGKIIERLKKRRIEGFYCENAAEAKDKALSFVKEGDTVSFGGSETIKDTGIRDALKIMNGITVLDRADADTPEGVDAICKKAFSCDEYFMSTNAITISGEMVNIDGTGNRVAALIYGPKHVIVVAGMNKVVRDAEEGYWRIKNIASSPNCIRIGRNTPCANTGTCGDCYGDDSICSQTVITRRSADPDRIKVILVGESLGY